MTTLHLRKKDLELAIDQLETVQLQDPYSSIISLLKTKSLLNRLELSFQNQTDESEIRQITIE